MEILLLYIGILYLFFNYSLCHFISFKIFFLNSFINYFINFKINLFKIEFDKDEPSLHNSKK